MKSRGDVALNKLYYGDNLEVLRGFPDACVDLVYLDPPFNSNAGYNVLFRAADGAGAEASVEGLSPEYTVRFNAKKCEAERYE